MGGAGFTVQVTGLRELARAAKDARDTAVPLAMRRSNQEIADAVSGDAKAAAPRAVRSDGSIGGLAASVRGTAGVTSASVRAGGTSAVQYAQPIHWGWPRRNIKANPFLTNAAQKVEVDPTRWYNRVLGAASLETV